MRIAKVTLGYAEGLIDFAGIGCKMKWKRVIFYIETDYKPIGMELRKYPFGYGGFRRMRR